MRSLGNDATPRDSDWLASREIRRLADRCWPSAGWREIAEALHAAAHRAEANERAGSPLADAGPDWRELRETVAPPERQAFSSEPGGAFIPTSDDLKRIALSLYRSGGMPAARCTALAGELCGLADEVAEMERHPLVAVPAGPAIDFGVIKRLKQGAAMALAVVVMGWAALGADPAEAGDQVIIIPQHTVTLQLAAAPEEAVQAEAPPVPAPKPRPLVWAWLSQRDCAPASMAIEDLLHRGMRPAAWAVLRDGSIGELYGRFGEAPALAAWELVIHATSRAGRGFTCSVVRGVGIPTAPGLPWQRRST